MLLDDYADEQQWQELGQALGIDKPYYQQYGIFIADLFQGDLGQSIKERRPVIDVIAQRIWPTFQLGLAAFAFSVVIGIPLGVLSSIQRGSALDVVGQGGCLDRTVGPFVLAGHHVHVLVCCEAGLGTSFRSWRVEKHHPAHGDAGLGVHRRQSEAHALGHAGRAGLGIRQAGQGQGRHQQGRALEARFSKCT